jgi:toxin ParE1/3/4
MRIEFTSPALRDLEDLRIYLAERSASGLANVLGDIESTVFDIPKSVARGRKTPRDDVWERVSNRYKFVIPYHVRGGVVYILRIYHPKREPLDYEALKL